jgi:hypothetical protein
MVPVARERPAYVKTTARQARIHANGFAAIKSLNHWIVKSGEEEPGPLNTPNDAKNFGAEIIKPFASFVCFVGGTVL